MCSAHLAYIRARSGLRLGTWSRGSSRLAFIVLVLYWRPVPRLRRVIGAPARSRSRRRCDGNLLPAGSALVGSISSTSTGHSSLLTLTCRHRAHVGGVFSHLLAARYHRSLGALQMNTRTAAAWQSHPPLASIVRSESGLGLSARAKIAPRVLSWRRLQAASPAISTGGSAWAERSRCCSGRRSGAVGGLFPRRPYSFPKRVCATHFFLTALLL